MVRRPHPHSRDSQDQETFLAPSSLFEFLLCLSRHKTLYTNIKETNELGQSVQGKLMTTSETNE